jgi:hypothetical protein
MLVIFNNISHSLTALRTILLEKKNCSDFKEVFGVLRYMEVYYRGRKNQFQEPDWKNSAQSHTKISYHVNEFMICFNNIVSSRSLGVSSKMLHTAPPSSSLFYILLLQFGYPNNCNRRIRNMKLFTVQRFAAFLISSLPSSQTLSIPVLTLV